MFGELFDLASRVTTTVTGAVGSCLGLSDKDITSIQNLVELGFTAYQIADMTGIAESVIEQVLTSDS